MRSIDRCSAGQADRARYLTQRDLPVVMEVRVVHERLLRVREQLCAPTTPRNPRRSDTVEGGRVRETVLNF